MSDLTTERHVDPVTLTVVGKHLENIVDEMVRVMVRSSYSPIFSESWDFSCMIFDAECNLISQAEMNPAIMCAGIFTVPATVEAVGRESFKPGDVVAQNDPYMGSCHMPEHMLLRPMFFGDELVGFAANIGHIAEIGGKAVGSFAADATDIFQEGLRLPPLKLMDEGRYCEDAWRVILANHRTPKYTWGDFHAMIASLVTAERRIAMLLERHSTDAFRAITEALLDHAEQWMRAELRGLPNGEYRFEDCMEDDGVSDGPYYIRAAVVVEDDEVIVDYSDSDAQATGPINCTHVVSSSAAYTAILQALEVRDVPLNGGAFRPITVIAPPGTIVNVKFPGPCVGGNTETQPRVIETVLGALAEALPDRIGAACGGTGNIFLYGGVHPETGEFYTHVHWEGPGWGGRPGQDGNDAQLIPSASLAKNTPIEVVESRFPWRLRECELRRDSGGAGEFRGGLGVRRTFEVHAPSITVSALMDRTRVKPWGTRGGGPGTNAGIRVRRRGSEDFETFSEAFGTHSPSKFTNVVLEDGDQVMLLGPGGGGWGDPYRRDADRVLADVRRGFVSRDAAERDYGVVLVDSGDGGLAMDERATAEMRRRV